MYCRTEDFRFGPAKPIMLMGGWLIFPSGVSALYFIDTVLRVAEGFSADSETGAGTGELVCM